VCGEKITNAFKARPCRGV
ncbi:hypothetical protein, partial [Sicyoidochytrium minutum DNA virus]